MTKEECFRALKYIKQDSEVYSQSNGSEMEYAFNVLETALNDYFNKVDDLEKAKEIYMKLCDDVNPPLKYHDIKPPMWVWDNKEHDWKIIYGLKGYQYNDDIVLLDNEISYDAINLISEQIMRFEENRFYRKQVGK